MQVVNFAFDRDVPPERQDALVADIASWPEVRQAKRLDPAARDAGVSRLSYLYLHQDQPAGPVIERLKAIPEIESASTPTPRKLI